MGRASTKEDKSIYQTTRESLSLTRDKASELLEFISADRIEKIENGKVNIQPEDVLAMSKCYKSALLCNHYCSHECPIGQQYIPELKFKDLATIAVETLNGLNHINKEKDRLLEIVEDGRVNPDEAQDFFAIKKTLDKIALSVATLQLWVNQSIAEGQLTDDLSDNN